MSSNSEVRPCTRLLPALGRDADIRCQQSFQRLLRQCRLFYGIAFVDVAGVTGVEHRLIADLGFDSVALVRVVVEIETAFDVELPQERLFELRTATVRDLAALAEGSGAAE